MALNSDSSIELPPKRAAGDGELVGVKRPHWIDDVFKGATAHAVTLDGLAEALMADQPPAMPAGVCIKDRTSRCQGDNKAIRIKTICVIAGEGLGQGKPRDAMVTMTGVAVMFGKTLRLGTLEGRDGRSGRAWELK